MTIDQAIIDQTIAYYADLLIYQYISKPKAYATVGLLASAGICDIVPQDISAAFDIDTAEGAQLDILGQYIGFSRNIIAPITRDYFAFVDYNAPVTTTGFTDYTDNTVNFGSTFYLYIFSDTTFYTLSDPEYRPLLKLKILLNKIDETLYTIANDLFTFFGNQIIAFDQADMSMSYLVSPDASKTATLAVSQGLLPKPMGVRISGVFIISNPALLFAFQDYEHDNGNTTGFSDYTTGFNGEYWLNYTDRIG